MRNSVLFCGRHKADNPAGIPFFQVLLLSLQVLDNSCNHLPLSVLLSKLLDRYRGIFIEVVNGHAEILCENLEFISFRLATTGFPIG